MQKAPTMKKYEINQNIWAYLLFLLTLIIIEHFINVTKKST